MKVNRDSLLQNLIALVAEQTYDNLFIGNNRLTLAFESSFAVVFQHDPSSADLTILSRLYKYPKHTVILQRNTHTELKQRVDIHPGLEKYHSFKLSNMPPP